MHADRKSTQRSRLLNGMRHVAVRDGYAAASIAQVIAHAGVSRPTFYEYFTDKDDCFLAALAEIQQQLLADIARAIGDSPAENAAETTITTLAGFASCQPERAQFLMNEPLAGGPSLLDARDQGLEEIARIIEQAHAGLASHIARPDVPARVLLGATYRLLARRLREGTDGSPGIPEDLLAWVESYERPLHEHSWRTLEPIGRPEPWAILPETLLSEPAAIPHRRRGDSNAVAENQRRRILFATAAVAESKGYAATTIADITARASLDRRAFNALFADKHDAFMALIAFGFQRTMAVTAGAFSTAASWPDRIWEAGRAFTEFVQRNPALANIGFVEPYAVGADAAQRAEDSFTAFTIFLRVGLANAGDPARIANPLALEAVATAIFEAGYYASRRDGSRSMSDLLPQVAFLCLAPIIGAQEATEFIDGRLSREKEPRGER
jgi:AcrR family transcriptional regulator